MINFEELTIEDLQHVYMIIQVEFNASLKCFIPKFLEEKGIFETREKAYGAILEFDETPRIWYSIAPLWIPKDFKSRNFLECLNLDTVIKQKVFFNEEEQEEIIQTDGAKIITIQEAWGKDWEKIENNQKEDEKEIT